MKKIGIVTFHRAENYGAVLQAYALQKKINDEIGECEIIDYRDPIIEKPYRMFYFANHSLKSILKGIMKGILFFNRNICKKREFKKFYNKMKMSCSVYNTKNIKNYDILITGSDQVWNSEITGGLSDIYTLNFGGDNVKRISYAASIGNSYIKAQELSIYKEKISIIDKISVREKEAKEELKRIINKEIEVVFDPTLLLTKEQWEKEIINVKCQNRKYILAYVIAPDEEYVKIVNYMSKELGDKVIHFSPRKRGLKNIIKNKYTAGPLEFLTLIKNAEYIICTSFHATVFSIIFNKKFFVIPHKKTGSRVLNLLKCLGIEDRAIKTLDELRNKDIYEEINYKKVNELLKREREKSFNWLKDAIDW